MTIKQVLMAGAALCTLGLAPALAAKAPHFSVAALHGGGVIKTTMHAPKGTNVTYTFSVTTAVSTATAHKVKTKLAKTFYTFQSNGSICQAVPGKVKLAMRKTAYAILSTATETYSYGCSTGPTKFYGDVYDLKSKKAAGMVDKFVSVLEAKFTSGGVNYNGDLNLDVSVSIGA